MDTKIQSSDGAQSGASLRAASGSEAVCPREAVLKRRLLTLASWAQSRTMGKHDIETTLTMLDRKVTELREAVYKAGGPSPDQTLYNGHTRCRKCGGVHWMYGECPPNIVLGQSA